jgi:hypothetical protein
MSVDRELDELMAQLEPEAQAEPRAEEVPEPPTEPTLSPEPGLADTLLGQGLANKTRVLTAFLAGALLTRLLWPLLVITGGVMLGCVAHGLWTRGRS